MGSGDDTFFLSSRLGRGGQGTVYLGESRADGKAVAVKITKVPVDEADLTSSGDSVAELNPDAEFVAYAGIANEFQGFPRVFYSGKDERGRRVIAMELLGPSLHDLLSMTRGRGLGLSFTLKVAIHMLCHLEDLHSSGRLMVDLKPANLCLGMSSLGHVITKACDLGISLRFKKRTNVHCRKTRGNDIVGSPKYISLSNHDGISLSRRDDLESLAYVLVKLLECKLPWEHISTRAGGGEAGANDDGSGTVSDGLEEALEGIRALKAEEPEDPSGIFQRCSPVFTDFLLAARSLGFKDKPDYKALRKMFARTLQDISVAENGIGLTAEDIPAQCLPAVSAWAETAWVPDVPASFDGPPLEGRDVTPKLPRRERKGKEEKEEDEEEEEEEWGRGGGKESKKKKGKKEKK